MNTALWILTIVLSIGFAIGGSTQILLSKERFRALGRSAHWVDDFDPRHITAIGTIKVVGALGLVLPAIVGIAPVLVPLAACGLALVMTGAGTTRFRRNEWGYLVGDLVLLALCAFLAWGRFALAPFEG
ncbi:DoxX family protein [Janibacter cremeus]|uniref:DoxX family protein n=1 Tax=Janibacter cremeus TaxID=1285192 RepID=UPI0023F703F4|nr:DoxX family protein [Janibacter cremeus]WEV78744.1 DoxX family protein [Janibacter cremeus]